MADAFNYTGPGSFSSWGSSAGATPNAPTPSDFGWKGTPYLNPAEAPVTKMTPYTPKPKTDVALRTVASGAATAAKAAAPAAQEAMGFLAKANPYIAAGSAVLGIAQSLIAARKLKQLDKQKPMGYQVTPEEQEAYQRSKQGADYGFSQQQKDAYLGGMARQQDVNYQRALAAGGGGLAGALGASTSRTDLSQFAMSDAQLKQQKEREFRQAGMDISRKRDLMAQQSLAEYSQKQQAWGGALKAGLENVTNVANLAMATGYSNNA